MSESNIREELLKSSRAPRLDIEKESLHALSRAARKFAHTPTAHNAVLLQEAYDCCSGAKVSDAEDKEFSDTVTSIAERREAKELEQMEREELDPMLADDDDEEAEE